MKIYIAGPMTGIKEFNYPAFFDAEKVLKEVFPGCEIVSPASREASKEDIDKPWEWHIRNGLKLLIDGCNRIVFLPGWRRSKGANLEFAVGSALGMGFFELVDGVVIPMKEKAVDEAKRLVYGDRGANYGHPFQDYSKTAAIWSVILGTKVTAEKAILCMVAVKISRELNLPKRDNLVDIIGYVECLNQVRELTDKEKREMLLEIGL